jgi:transposase-like protein
MKRLGRDKHALIVRCLTEGAGINAVARMAGVSKNTVLRGSTLRGMRRRPSTVVPIRPRATLFS